MDRFHESPIDAEQAERHSSEALASTSNVEIEAPSTIRELRGLIQDLLAKDGELRFGDVTAIDGEDGVLGIEYCDTLYFIEIKEA